MNRIFKILSLFFYFIFISVPAQSETSRDSLLIGIRNHQFDKVKYLTSISNDNNIADAISYYNSILSEYGIYRHNDPLKKNKIFASHDHFLNALQYLNLACYNLLYEYDNESVAYKNLIRSYNHAQKTGNKVLLCEIFKTFLLYYSKLINIVNKDFFYFLDKYKESTYDKTENQILKILDFNIRLEFGNNRYSPAEVSRLEQIKHEINIPFYKNLCYKTLAIYYELYEKNYDKAIDYYSIVYKKNINLSHGVDINLRETNLLCLSSLFATKKDFQKNIIYLKKMDTSLRGKTIEWNNIFKYSSLSNAYAGLKKYDSAFVFKEKSRIVKMKFDQERHDAIINQLNGKIKDDEIDIQKGEISNLHKTKKLLTIGLSTFFILLILLSVYLYFINYKKKVNEQKQKILNEKILLEKELEKQRSIQNERARISRDMHDEIGAGISAIKLQSEILKQQINNKNINTQEIDELIGISENMNHSMREMLWSLNSDNDSFDNFADYCFHYLENYFSKTKINFSFQKNADNEKRHLNSETRRNLLLIIKEAAHNIVKHSQSTDAYFEISEKAGNISILIKDNGKGFISDTASSGYGLHSMRSRAENIGGRFSISSDSRGTIIEVHTFL